MKATEFDTIEINNAPAQVRKPVYQPIHKKSVPPVMQISTQWSQLLDENQWHPHRAAGHEMHIIKQSDPATYHKIQNWD